MTASRTSRLAMMMLLAVCGVAVTTSSALAVDPAAELLFQEGRRLLLVGHFVDACARFTQSYSVEASSGTLLNLALCNEKVGKPATALAQYRDTVRLAQEQGRDDRARAALERATALELTVPMLTLVAAKPIAGLMTATDGGTFHDGGLDTPVPVDPGSHKISATAPGRQPWETSIDVKEGERRTLEIPDLELQPPPLTAPEVISKSDGVPTIQVDAAPVHPTAPASARSKVDLFGAAGGGILFLAGGVIWTVAVAKFDSAMNACNTAPGCTLAERESRVSTIQRLEVAAFGTWIAAGAMWAGSAVHHWWGNKSPPSIALTPSASGAAFSVSGAF